MELSPLIRRVWLLAASEAVQAKEEFIQPDHLFIAALKMISTFEQWKKDARDLAKEQPAELKAPPPILEDICGQFRTVGLDPDAVRRRLRQRRGQGQHEWPEKRGTVHRSEATHRVFRQSAARPDAEVLLTDVLLALLDEHLLEEGGKRLDVLRELAIDLARLRVALASPPGPDSHATVHPAPADQQERVEPKPGPADDEKSAALRARIARRPTPAIDRFTRDLTQMARDGKLTEPIGRRKEMLQVVRTLERETKNNPVLVGEAGVGKTAVVEGLAWRIAKGRAPRAVLDKRIVQLDMAALTAGTKYRGEFEERLNGIMKDARDSPDVVVFVDEIHQLMGAGAVGNGVLDAGELLKPALARGEIRMIGATTPDEYRLIEKDKALARRFQPVPVSEPTRAEAIQILEAVAARKADSVRIGPGVVEAAVDLAVRYMTDRRLPDSAIDLLEEACSQVAVQWTSRIPGEDVTTDDDDEVSADTLAAVIERLKGIPAGRLKEADRERLGGMAAALKARVIGQDAACDLVAEAVHRARAGLVAAGRPLRVLLFLGPTGVGKTHLAKATAEYLFGSEQSLARLDMSEFHERHTVSRLIGSPPGYVGHDEEPQLTRILRRQPHCVMLLDEFDRAHLAVQDLFLQVFDEGRVTDAKGRTADATNVLFILTSNLSADVREKPGFRARGFDEARRALVDQGLKPEIVNRVDDVVVFRALDAGDVARIADRLLHALRDRLTSQGIGLRWDERVVHLLAGEGHSVEFGVRELKRVVERRVENPIAGMVIRDEVNRGRVVALSVAHGDLVATAAAAGEGTSV